jgi:hypothetical protein
MRRRCSDRVVGSCTTTENRGIDDVAFLFRTNLRPKAASFIEVAQDQPISVGLILTGSIPLVVLDDGEVIGCPRSWA